MRSPACSRTISCSWQADSERQPRRQSASHRSSPTSLSWAAPSQQRPRLTASLSCLAPSAPWHLARV
eukprot:8321269-Alexandrium_andersonii.AAC.1